eukprot:Polyplicarium_translucidae@DN2456_c0_g1_i7.p3
MKCGLCGTEPTQPAICLLCKALLCVQSDCCRVAASREGECTRHARICNGGQGLFMLPHIGMLLAVDAPTCGFLEAPYVDRHGEVDVYLRRGRPLFLSGRRFDELRMCATLGELGREIVRSNEKNSSYMHQPL